LHVARVESFGSGGVVGSDMRYSDWQQSGDRSYPRQIDIARPGEDYQLAIHITKLTVNAPLAADAFTLKQLPGEDMVRVGEDGSEKTDPASKEPPQ
jgi:hypothetical protein